MKTDSFHKFIVLKFIEKKESCYTNIIERESARRIMYLNHIPVKIHNDFLRELEKLKLIKVKNKRNIAILKGKEDLE